MFKVGDEVVLVRDWQSESNRNRLAFYSDFLNRTFKVTRVEQNLLFVDDEHLDGAFKWRFELANICLENK